MKKSRPVEKKIYIVDPEIKWKTFKLLQEKLVKKEGPVPMNFDRILWELIRDKRIYAWFDPKVKGDMRLGLELPKNRVIYKLSTP